MTLLQNLSDDDIDALLLLLFSGQGQNLHQGPSQHQHQHRQQESAVSPTRQQATSLQDLSHDALLRIRSRNHPDKWPNVNQAAYQAAVEELDRRRKTTR